MEHCCNNCNCFNYPDDEPELDDDEIEDMEIRRLQQIVGDCTCGAWGVDNSGEIINIADCCCGAE